MLYTRFLLVMILASLMGTNSCSQPNAGDAGSSVYVGSTPCDSLIRSTLQIPPGLTCDFIKWKVRLQKDSATFQLAAQYGESKPNTNGFFNDGHTILISGKYLVEHPTKPMENKIYRLEGVLLQQPVLLVEMDENILHFADVHNNLLIGNGGWGYILNKTQ
ncbi:MAG: hypothetical protein JWP81_4656 [Ferruginibacter sp.]|nr:hypothetical protein [Ferruginibacter sp.]